MNRPRPITRLDVVRAVVSTLASFNGDEYYSRDEQRQMGEGAADRLGLHEEPAPDDTTEAA